MISRADFTTAKIAGSCRWDPPEVLNPPSSEECDTVTDERTTEGDVWSFGMTVLEVRPITFKPLITLLIAA